MRNRKLCRKMMLVLIFIFTLQIECHVFASEGIFEQPMYDYDMPSVVPVFSHPRILFTADKIDFIKANMMKPQNLSALNVQTTLAQSQTDGLLDTTLSDNGNNSILGIIRAKAFDYAINGNVTNGTEAVTAMKNYLSTYRFPPSVQGNVANYYNPSYTIYISAIVYDWCYPLLNAPDKEFIVSSVQNSIAVHLNYGWPLENNIGAMSGYGNLTMILRDFLSFGIAVYDEYPDIYNYIGSIILTDYVPARNFWYGSKSHNMGTNYSPRRIYSDLYAQWLFKTISGREILFTDLYEAPYQSLYYYLPNDQHFLEGDDDFQKISSTNKDVSLGISEMFFMASAMSGNPYYKTIYERFSEGYTTFSKSNSTAYAYMSISPAEFLIINNPALESESLSQLPKTKYLKSPNGTMIARTGFDHRANSSDVGVFMKIGENIFSNHQHYDSGTFQIYYKGMLSADRGHYANTGTAQYENWNIRTVSHNGLLIYDPDSYEMPNDGGQREIIPDWSTLDNWLEGEHETGKVLAYGYGPDPMNPAYSYISGDITKAYGERASEVRRSMMFMPTENENIPAVFMVMDKIESNNPNFKKTFLLQAMEEPEIDGNTVLIKRTTGGYSGQLAVQTLLPKNPVIAPIGGKGQQWYVNGVNYVASNVNEQDMDYGWGRVEISPTESNKLDYFLHVMEVGETGSFTEINKAELIENESVLGAKILNKVSLFNKNSKPIANELEFVVPGSGDVDVAVCGLARGEWTIYQNGSVVGSAEATTQNETIYFSTGSGKIRLVNSVLEKPELSLIYELHENTEKYKVVWDKNNSEDFMTYSLALYDTDDIDNPLLSYADFSENEFELPSNIQLGKSYKLQVMAKAENPMKNSDSTQLIINTMFGRGNGTEAMPYELHNARHFNNIRYHLNGTFRLVSDISTPVTEMMSGVFKGKLIGYNKTKEAAELRTVNICITGDESEVGLFQKMGVGAKIENIRLVGSVTSSKGEVGGFAGKSDSWGIRIIKNCVNEANITGASNVGGLIGVCGSGTVITNSINKGNVFSFNYRAGGLVGECYGAEITGCYNTGNVATQVYAGGILGRANGGIVSIKNSYNAGEIRSSSTLGAAGGLMGWTTEHVRIIENCYNVGEIISGGRSGPIIVYPVAGLDYDTRNNYYLSANAQDDGVSGTTPKSLEEMENINFYESLGTAYQAPFNTNYQFPEIKGVLNDSVLIINKVEINVPSEGGNIDKEGVYYVKQGKVFTFLLSPSPGYYLEYIHLNKIKIYINSDDTYSYQTPPITENLNISAGFKDLNLPDEIASVTYTFTPFEKESFMVGDKIIYTPFGISFSAVKSNYSGYIMIECGMLFTNNENKADDEFFKIGTEDVKKYPALNINNKGLYGIGFYGGGIKKGRTYYVRSYAIYKNINDETKKIIYGEEIASFTPVV